MRLRDKTLNYLEADLHLQAERGLLVRAITPDFVKIYNKAGILSSILI
jgi:hypothetical protein